jgi:uncharacterized RDD family membrane protein YckC
VTPPPPVLPYGRPVDPYAGHLAAADPTKALWRRIFAYLIDGLVGSLVVLALLAAADLDTVDAAGCPSDDLPGGRTCIDLPGDDTDDTVVLADRGPLVAAVAVGFGWVLLNDVVLQGLTGATVGKFVTGARVVRPAGQRPGLWRAFVRTLLLPIDLINLILPLGLWVAMFSRGHRRIGDMVGGTYVVKARYAGEPLAIP